MKDPSEVSGIKAFLMVVLVSFGIPIVALLVAVIVLAVLRVLGLGGDWSTADPTCTGIACW
jgi:hypothetical protein